MKLTLIDSRTLGIALAQPAAAKWLNWATGAWESPFAGSSHVRTLQPMAPAPDPHAVIQTAEIGSELLSRSDVIGIVYAIDPGGGTPTYTPVDLTLAPLPIPMGCLGGMARY
ncbi:MAG: hypothetical protein KGR26_07315 [Cyanobacteria bacterium REEB65]|nr:hypothetical protein [Cyanobacteria bacterium REEB65]